jgi:hypothetical protein
MFTKLTHTPLFRSIAVMVIVAFVTMIPAQSGYAQMVVMPKPGIMINPTGKFDPALMMGLRVDVKNPFNFYFIMDKGQASATNDAAKEEYQKLIKYFLASLTIANRDMWVNLSPVEADRIIPDNFAETEMGRDLLAQDYILKQFTASLMYPEGKVGQEFWSKIYARAYDMFGTTEIPIDTFNKVWITADRADIYQKNDTAFLYNSHLKVMLEQDFMAMEKNKEQFGNAASDVPESDDARKVASDIVREVIIPVIEKEVNEGANFAQVRQIYNSMIMATWFKRTLRESLLGQAYADKDKVAGVQVNDPQAREKIYQQYLEAYKVGVFNYIKEEMDPVSREMLPRKYFSGGSDMGSTIENNMVVTKDVPNNSQIAGKLKTLVVVGAMMLLTSLFAGQQASAQVVNQDEKNKIEMAYGTQQQEHVASLNEDIKYYENKAAGQLKRSQNTKSAAVKARLEKQYALSMKKVDGARTELKSFLAQFMSKDTIAVMPEEVQAGEAKPMTADSISTVVQPVGTKTATNEVNPPTESKPVLKIHEDGTWTQEQMGPNGTTEIVGQGTRTTPGKEVKASKVTMDKETRQKINDIKREQKEAVAQAVHKISMMNAQIQNIPRRIEDPVLITSQIGEINEQINKVREQMNLDLQSYKDKIQKIKENAGIAADTIKNDLVNDAIQNAKDTVEQFKEVLKDTTVTADTIQVWKSVVQDSLKSALDFGPGR